MGLQHGQEDRALERIEKNMNIFASQFSDVFKRLDDIEARLTAVEKSKSTHQQLMLPKVKSEWKVDESKLDHSKLVRHDLSLSPSSMWLSNQMNNRVVKLESAPSEKLLGTAFKVPIRIILIRHGESLGNVDPKAYALYQDHAVPLTDRGVKMSESTGTKLSGYIKELSAAGSLDLRNDSIGIFVSPYARTRATLQGLLDGGLAEFIKEENVWESQYLTERDFGLFEGDGWKLDDIKKMPEYERNNCKRAKNGKFYARCPNGESVKDVVLRADLFTRRLLRRYLTSSYRLNTFVVVSHGITIRAFIMRWFHHGPLWYEKSTNHPNCSVYEIFDKESKFIYGGYDKNAELVDVKELNQSLVRGDEVQHKYDFKRKSSLK